MHATMAVAIQRDMGTPLKKVMLNGDC
jgi:hypothetical protein